jgi:hypothetical protein
MCPENGGYSRQKAGSFAQVAIGDTYVTRFLLLFNSLALDLQKSPDSSGSMR